MARNRQGKKPNAEDRQGDKTHREFLKNLATNAHRGEEAREAADRARPISGHHRLHEDRQQHDEAENGSEITESERLGG
jgi:hypothetical protein